MTGDDAQRITLGILLEAHPAMLTLDELRAKLPDVEVDDAVHHLAGDGLANRVGDLVGASRAAVRGDQLRL